MDREFLIDLFADFGPVTIRKMFSGYGISADGINFALALRAGLFFRADEVTIPDFEAEGSKPFQYSTRAKTVLVNSYWELPARLFDDSEELAQWARAALAARAQRGAKGKKRPKAKKRAAKKTRAQKRAARRREGAQGGRSIARPPVQRGKRTCLVKVGALAFAVKAAARSTTSHESTILCFGLPGLFVPGDA